MDLDDAKALWAADTLPDAPTDDPSQSPSTTDMSSQSLSDSEILQFVQETSRTFDRRIWWRDLSESLAALFVIVLFGWIAWTTSGLAQIGAWVLVAGGLFIPWHLYRTRTRHARLPADDSVANRLHAERDKVKDQIDLLRSIAVWYVGPLALGALLLIIGKNGWSWWSLPQIAVIIGVSVGVYQLNQKAVRQDLRPRHRELTDMIEQMESEE